MSVKIKSKKVAISFLEEDLREKIHHLANTLMIDLVLREM
jgi:hypothetical protein